MISLLTFCSLTCLATLSLSHSFTKEDFLPTDLVPATYKIEIQTLLRLYNTAEVDREFNGNLTFVFWCVNATDKIVLHSKNIKGITKDTVRLVAGPPDNLPKVVGVSHEGRSDQLTISLDRPLSRGKSYRLFICNYVGYMGASEGYYLKPYETKDGRTKYMGTTQFEATHARKAFPCMDEPSYKAKFQVTILRRTDLKTISNMKLKQSYDDPRYDGFIADEFEMTPIKMSTYLVAWVVSDFPKRLSGTVQGIQVSIYARDDVKQPREVFEATKTALAYFSTYTGILYQLDKLDVIGIPKFTWGGMENWGLVTFAEDQLNCSSNVGGHCYVAVNTAFHEVAHQELHRRMMLSMLLKLDAHTMLKSGQQPMRAIQEASIDPKESWEHMWVIYEKGNEVLQMLEDAIGQETFRRGMQMYLNAYRFGNANSSELCRVLENALQYYGKGSVRQFPIEQFIAQWIRKRGYPLLTLTRMEDGRVRASQIKFEDKGPALGDSETWPVPVQISSGRVGQDNGWSTAHLLDSKVSTFRLPGALVNHWIIANINRTAYYRVNYDKENWDRLARELNRNYEAIPARSRAILLDDAVNIARAGLLDATTVMKLTNYLGKERDALPLWTVTDNFPKFYLLLSNISCDDELKVYLKSKLSPAFEEYDKIFEESPSVADTMIHEAMFPFACKLGLPSAVARAKSVFNQWRANEGYGGLVRTAICYTVKHGEADDVEFIWQRFLHKNRRTDRHLSSALGCSDDTDSVKKLLAMVELKDSDLLADDVIPVIAEWSDVKFLALQWVLKRIFKNFGRERNEQPEYISLLRKIAQYFPERWLLNEVRRHAEMLPDTDRKEFREIMDSFETDIAWKEKNQMELCEWLRGQGFGVE